MLALRARESRYSALAACCLRPRPEVGGPVNGCNIVIGVEDVDGLMARGVELGGTEALPASDWPGIGRGGYLVDPDGNVFGLISPVLSDGTVAMGAGAEA